MVSKKPAPTVVVLASKKPKVASRVLVKRAIASLTRQGKAKQIEAIEEPKSKVKTLGKKLPRSKNSDRFVSSITVKIPKPETSPAYFADGTSKSGTSGDQASQSNTHAARVRRTRTTDARSRPICLAGSEQSFAVQRPSFDFVPA